MNRVIGIDGLDRLGKSTLIENIQHRLGFHQVIHFGKPKILNFYTYGKEVRDKSRALFRYQSQSFIESMILARSGARLIFDRSWIGEAVYGPIYRQTDGDYVFDLEKQYGMDTADIRLILLTENFEASRHFVSDGESFDDSKRQEEQKLFINAFNRSIIAEKRMICVTDTGTGYFRSPESILQEALE